ncbi:MAG TPA: response regulator [Burkholderiales bacterium]|nr:response regulator [Burkholderiales bacterium]
MRALRRESEALVTDTSIPRHILIVDDDAELRTMVADYLGDYDLRVSGVDDGASMREVMAREVVDLILLDLKLPSEDGMNLARELRESSSVPIIILTGRKDDVDRIMGLELGADDYLTKPFNLRELLARIRAILRRAQAHAVPAGEGRAPQAFRFGGWELDLRSRRLTSNDGERVELTHAEFALLSAFLGAPERILSREQLLELSRGSDDNVFDRSIDVQILRLRRKIEADPSRPRLIRTERGAGYFFNSQVEVVA